MASRKGCEKPRVFTPPLRRLTRSTSLGYLFAQFCEDVLHCPLLPWQRWLAIHGMEIVGSPRGEWHFRFRTVIVLVARQNGKSKFLAMLNLFFLYVLGSELTLGTAQNLDTANEVWEDAVSLAESEEELAQDIVQIRRGAGQRSMKLDGNHRYKVVSASRSGGRGNTADLVSMDELREQLDWSAWGAVTKTTMARPNAQTWCFSNAGDASSVVLRTLRLRCHAALGDPDGAAAAVGEMLPDGLGEDAAIALFEWSAVPGCDIYDRKSWAQANPSLGYGFMTERALASSASTDPEDVFRTECLCQWVEALVVSAFPDGAWEETTDRESGVDPESDVHYGIDVSHDRNHTAIAECRRRKDGLWYVEAVAYRPGYAWAFDWLADHAPCSVAAQGRGAPVSAYLDDIEELEGVELVRCEGSDLGAWCGRFYDSVAVSVGGGDAVEVRHRPQPVLDNAARVAQTKRMGDGAWAWNRNTSPDDISPLVAATMAFGAATAKASPKGPRVYDSVYAGRGLMVI